MAKCLRWNLIGGSSAHYIFFKIFAKFKTFQNKNLREKHGIYSFLSHQELGLCSIYIS